VTWPIIEERISHTPDAEIGIVNDQWGCGYPFCHALCEGVTPKDDRGCDYDCQEVHECTTGRKAAVTLQSYRTGMRDAIINRMELKPTWQVEFVSAFLELSPDPQRIGNNNRTEAVMRTLSVGVVLAAFLCSPHLSAQSPAPKQEKLLFENEYVRAYEVTLNPGDKLTPHESGNRLIYSFTTYSLRYHWDNRVSEERRKPGDLHYHPSGVHAEENAGKQRATFLIVERTSKPLPAVELVGSDMARASPSNTRVLFDREMAKVFEVTLPPRDAVAMHLGLNRLVYALTGYSLGVQTPDGKEVRESGKKGSMKWHSAGLHGVQNKLDASVKFLVFAFKR
jgi:hypothetical protein